jgi:hypothetical protein
MVLFQLRPDLDQTIATQDQLSDQVHHAVETFGLHADGGILFHRFRLFFLFVQRLIQGARSVMALAWSRISPNGVLGSG